jgi:hypothetical protein
MKSLKTLCDPMSKKKPRASTVASRAAGSRPQGRCIRKMNDKNHFLHNEPENSHKTKDLPQKANPTNPENHPPSDQNEPLLPPFSA